MPYALLVAVRRGADDQERAEQRAGDPVGRIDPGKSAPGVGAEAFGTADVAAVDVEDDEAGEHEEEVAPRVAEAEDAAERFAAEVFGAGKHPAGVDQHDQQRGDASP